MAEKKLNIRVGVKGTDKAAKGLKKVDKSMVSLGKSALKAGAAFFGARAIISGLKTVTGFAAQSGKIKQMSQAFNTMGKTIGFTGKSLDKLRTATDGTLNSFDLMKQANNAMLLGISKSDDEMAELFDTAQRLAAAVGQDATFGIESLVTGLGRQSRMMLDNLGIIVDSNKAYDDYAKVLKKSTSELTEAERKTAFLIAGMEQARRKADSLGKETLTTSQSVDALKASWFDLTTEIGGASSGIIKTAIEQMSKLAGQWTEMFKIMKDRQVMETAEQYALLATELTKAEGKAKDLKAAIASTEEGGVTDVGTLLAGAQGGATFVKEDDNAKLLEVEATIKRITADMFAIRGNAEPLIAPETIEIAGEVKDATQVMADAAGVFASSMSTSVISGDNLGESLKRATIQMAIMVVQAKLYEHFMTLATGGINKISAGIVNLFGGGSPAPLKGDVELSGDGINAVNNFNSLG